MVFVGHLDVMRMFERAIRRAGLPVSQDGCARLWPPPRPASLLPSPLHCWASFICRIIRHTPPWQALTQHWRSC